MPHPTTTELFNAALEADAAWQRALIRVYGTAAAEARYDSRGTAIPELRKLYDAKVAADLALHRANSIYTKPF